MEHVLIVDGKTKKKETKEYVGVFSLPYSANLGFWPEKPPFGHREEVTKEKLAVLGKEQDVTRIAWILKDPDRFANFDAQKITFWVSGQVKTPRFLLAFRFFPINQSRELPLPEGTVQFEHLPREKFYKGDPEGKGKITITGKLIGQKDIMLSSKKIRVFLYSWETKSAEEHTKGEFWLSKEVPGGLYRLSVEKTNRPVSRLTLQVTKLGVEAVPADLHHVPEGEFAFTIPKGWKLAKPRKKEELVALVPLTPDPDLHRTIIINMKPAAGKGYRDWANNPPLFDEKKNGLAFENAIGLGDIPVFLIHHWPASDKRVNTFIIGGVRDDRLFLISHWQDRVEARTETGSEPLRDLIRTWRWLKKKAQ